jgi:hypothetical protein
MNRSGLATELFRLARPRGYRKRGYLLWRARAELTELIHVQGSSWGHGVYVNFGVTPNALVTKTVPPGPGYWALELRPTSWKSPYFAKFCRCERDHDDNIDSDDMRESLQWVLDWIDENLTSDALRAAVANRSSWLARSGLVTAILRDWAAHDLKEPSHYFEGTPYYG